MAFLASLLRSSDPCSEQANYFDQLKESLYENTLEFYKSSLEKVYAFDTFVNNNPSFSDAIKRSFGYFGQAGKCQTVGACVTDLWGAAKMSATDLSAGAGLSALIPSTKTKKVLPGNPNYKPYLEIMKKAVSEYRLNHPDKKVIYPKLPQKDIVDEKLVLEFMNKPLSDKICEGNESIFCKEPRRSPSDVMQSPDISELTNLRFSQYADIGMAFVLFLQHKGYGEAGHIMYDAQRKLSFGVGDDSVPNFVEDEYKRSGKFVENYKILEFALDLHDGDLYKALSEVDFFYKTYRGPIGENPGMLRFYVLDEFSQGTAWNELSDADPPKTYKGIFPMGNEYDKNDFRGRDFDLSWLNQTGNAYHTTNIIRLTRYFSPSLVALFMMAQGMAYADTQGLMKQLTDVTVTKDLYEIDSYLSQFDPDSPHPWPPRCEGKQ